MDGTNTLYCHYCAIPKMHSSPARFCIHEARGSRHCVADRVVALELAARQYLPASALTALPSGTQRAFSIAGSSHATAPGLDWAQPS
jgi:hypothetical protein